MSEMIRQPPNQVRPGFGPHMMYCLSQNFLCMLPYVKEYNGFADSRQVIVWYLVENEVDVELARSEGGTFTTTARFKELAIQLLQDNLA